MRTPIIVVATASACAAVLGALNVGAQINPGLEATPERCTPPKGSGFRLTVKSNTHGRVWLKQSVRNNVVTRKYYACSNTYRKHVYLASTQHEDLVDEGQTPPFSSMFVSERALDQVAVAFVKTTCNPAGENARCNYVLRWLRLRDGKIIRDFHTATPERPTTPIISGTALMFWVVDTSTSGPECTTPCEVRTAGERGDRTLDSGSNIFGLATDGRTVYWRNGNDVRGLDLGQEPSAALE